MTNQALQFSVLLESGALYTGIPIHMISTPKFMAKMELSKAQAYDCIGSNIQAITLDLLRYMTCTVKLNNDEIVFGKYLFTIDFLDDNGLARHPEQWKQFHVVTTSSGLICYPQYRIKFTDKALCPDFDKESKYKYNDVVHLSEI
jgi:hypothetical protein